MIQFTDAAKYYAEQKHQKMAWEWLQSETPDEIIEEFAGRYRQDAIEFTPASPFTYNITDHVTYGEITQNSEARRFTGKFQCQTCIEICEFLEKTRTAFGNAPIIITSGHRPPAINAAVGGASQSEHLYNKNDTGAVDFYLDGVDIYDLQNWCDEHWDYSLGYGAHKGFVHLGMRTGKPKVRWDY